LVADVCGDVCFQPFVHALIFTEFQSKNYAMVLLEKRHSTWTS
jgi:hypothetical protein